MVWKSSVVSEWLWGEVLADKNPGDTIFHPQTLQYVLEESCSGSGLQGAPVASLRTVPTRQIIFSNVSRSNKVNNPPHCDKNYLHEGKIFQSRVFAFLLSTLYLILLSLSLMFVLLHAFLIKFSLPRNSAAFSCCLFSINLIFLGAHCTRLPCPLSRLFTL